MESSCRESLRRDRLRHKDFSDFEGENFSKVPLYTVEPVAETTENLQEIE